MKPRDLTVSPPRSPWEKLDGLIMMPRTIDKMCARLPGGNLGQYKIAGSSVQLLDAIGVNESDLQAVVAAAHGDQEVAQWLRLHANTAAYADANNLLGERRLPDTNLEDIHSRYPISRDLPLDTRLLDLLVQDDLALFPDKSE